jgi:hypothetical protein
MDCPLCNSKNIADYHQDNARQYLKCDLCQLVFVGKENLLSIDEEKAVYDQHENSPHDANYREFLALLFEPLQKRIPPSAKGLDFGSGPGPTLSIMLEEAGHAVKIYDPIYAPDISVFDQSYDFITATEVAEHLHYPKQEFLRLWSCLKPGGTLGIMTQLAQGSDVFANWNYIRDPSHVCFYSQDTFEYLASRLNAKLEFTGKSVIFLQKDN